MEVNVPVVIPKEELTQAVEEIIQEHGLAQRNEVEWLNAKNAAKYLGVCSKTFYQWLNAGKIPSSMIDGIKRYSKKDLDAMMKKHQV